MTTSSGGTGTASHRPGTYRRLLIALIGAVVVAVAAIAVAVVQTARTPNSAPPQGEPSSAGSAPTPSPPGSAAPTPPEFEFGYQPLYPFADLSDARSWQSSYRSDGTDPWHLDAGKTALMFSQQYLGYTEIDTVTGTSSDSAGMHVGVGFLTPNATLSTAAVVHLVKFGPQNDAPWEVVGSDDTTFSLDAPQYGTRVTSPFTAAGRITGVDESIAVTVLKLGSPNVVAHVCCTAAGGDNQPWSMAVPMATVPTGVLTIVASTGGHLRQIERFAITSARA